jgi:hypothetical protein
MKAPKETSCDLKSSFWVSGKLKVPIGTICTHLEAAPFLKPSKSTKPNTFCLLESGGITTSELQLMGTKLIFNYSFAKSCNKEYAKNLVRFLSILAYLSDLYETDLSTLYPILMEVLVGYVEEMPYQNKKVENIELLVLQTKTLSEMNCSLSLKLIASQIKCQDLERENKNLLRFSKEAIEGAMARMGIVDRATASIPKITGTTNEAYEAVKGFVWAEGVNI